MSVNNITVTPNQRILGSYFINSREIIDLSSGVFNDTNPANSRPDATETIVNNTAKGGRIFLSTALFSTTKRISLLGTFSTQLYTYKDTYILDTNNSPATFVFDPINDIWSPAGTTTEAPATMRQNPLPLIQRANITIATGFNSAIGFGAALDLSSGAPTQINKDPLLIIGASSNYGQLGSAYVYQLPMGRNGQFFTFQESVTLPLTTNRETTSGTFIGTSVSILDDSSCLFVGFPENNDSRGSVLVYDLGNNQYTFVQEILNTVATGTRVGTATAVSKGSALLSTPAVTTMITSGPGLLGADGAVLIYRKSASTNTWVQFGATIIDPASPANTNFGAAVSITDDVRYFAVGSPQRTVGVGGVYVYRENFINNVSIGYVLDATIVPVDNIGAAQMGTSVKIIGSTSTTTATNSNLTLPRLIFGGPADNAGVGAIWVYERSSGGTWLPLQKILPAGFVTAGGALGLGFSLDFSVDMSIIVGGRPVENTNKGAVYIYNISAGAGTTYTQANYKLTNDSIFNALGTRTVISRDEQYIYSSGTEVMFSFNIVNNVYTLLKIFEAAFNPGTDAQGTSSLMNSVGDVLFIGAPGLIPGPLSFNRAGAVAVLIKDGSDDFFQQTFLRPNNLIGTAGFGACIAGSLELSRVYISGPTDNTNVGAFWYYSFPNAASNDFRNFTVQKIVKPAAPATTRFGLTLRCDNNGESIVVATSDATTAVWTFFNNGTTITQIGTFITGASVRFAAAIDITGDGLTLVIGDYNNHTIAVYNRISKSVDWVFSTNIVKAGTRIGVSLSISADSQNNTVLITTPLTTATNMFVFRRASPSIAWSEVPVGGIVIPSNVTGIVSQDFNTCCIDATGFTFIVSTQYSLAGLVIRGQAWVYQKKNDESWVLKGELVPRGNINFGLPGSSYANIPNYLYGAAMPRILYLNSRGARAAIGTPSWGGTNPVASGAVFFIN
jgi:hypothetical protein